MSASSHSSSASASSAPLLSVYESRTIARALRVMQKSLSVRDVRLGSPEPRRPAKLLH